MGKTRREGGGVFQCPMPHSRARELTEPPSWSLQTYLQLLVTGLLVLGLALSKPGDGASWGDGSLLISARRVGSWSRSPSSWSTLCQWSSEEPSNAILEGETLKKNFYILPLLARTKYKKHGDDVIGKSRAPCTTSQAGHIPHTDISARTYTRMHVQVSCYGISSRILLLWFHRFAINFAE